MGDGGQRFERSEEPREAIRIGVLLCDDVPEPDRSAHGDALQRSGGHARAVATALGGRATISAYDVRAGALPPADACEVFVTTGSATSPDSDEPWVAALREWLRDGLQANALRLYGVCFGHQLAAYALGAPVGRAPRGWQVGAARLQQLIRLRAGGADDPGDDGDAVDGDDLATGDDGAWRDQTLGAPATSTSERVLLQSHQDEVLALPPGARWWLRDEHSPVQGFVWRGRRGGAVVGVQGHPEFACAQVRDLYRRRRAVLGDRLCDEAIASAASPHDGLAVSAEALSWLAAGRVRRVAQAVVHRRDTSGDAGAGQGP